MGAAPNPAMVGWEKSWWIRGAGALHLHSASAGHVRAGSIIPRLAPASPSSCSAPRYHVSHRTVPAKSFGDGLTPSSPWPSWCPGVPLRAHPPILSSLPGSFLQSLATRVGREKREHQRHGGTMEGPARADPPHMARSIRIRPPSSFTSRLRP